MSNGSETLSEYEISLLRELLEAGGTAILAPRDGSEEAGKMFTVAIDDLLHLGFIELTAHPQPNPRPNNMTRFGHYYSATARITQCGLDVVSSRPFGDR